MKSSIECTLEREMLDTRLMCHCTVRPGLFGSWGTCPFVDHSPRSPSLMFCSKSSVTASDAKLTYRTLRMTMATATVMRRAAMPYFFFRLLSLSGEFTNINSWLYYYFLEHDVIVRELFEQISKYGNTQN